MFQMCHQFALALISSILLFSTRTSAINQNEAEIIIIGAGPAGIAAASRLYENNITNFKILEAENRIGGRVNSVQFGDAFVDLGAEWCHGEEGNIVYQMVKDFNILGSINYTFHFFYTNETVDQTLQDDFRTFIFDGYFEADSDPKNVITGDYLINRYKSIVIAKYKNDAAKLKIAEDALATMEHFVNSYEGSFSWFDVPLQSNYKECAGNMQLNWNGLGYKTILDVLIHKYPNPSQSLPIESKVILSKEIAQISWKDNNSTTKKIQIEASDATKYQADYVIFTPSIGVLKATHGKLFKPSLPANKVSAIEQLGIGAVMKVVLKFPNQWWQDSDNYFSFIWSREAKDELKDKFPEVLTEAGQSWLTNLKGLNQVANNPKVLSAWIVGSAVPQIEQLNDTLILKGVVYALNHFMGAQFNLSEPESMIRTRWYSNPHFRGVYSFDSLKGLTENAKFRKDLSAPLVDGENGAVLFAGEATHPHYFGTVHGAIETGRREADRIIEMYRKNI